MVCEVVQLDHRVIKNLRNLSITSGVWRQLIAVKQVSSFGKGVTSEWSEEINSVLGWEAKSISNSIDHSWDLDSRVIVRVLVDWVVQDWLWDYVTDLECWWGDDVDLWLGWEAEVFLAESDVLVDESVSVLVHLEGGDIRVTESHDDDGWLRSQTLLVIAGIKEAALHSVVETAEVHDLELLLWLLLLQQLAESEWETLMAPMAAIDGILNIED